jgi:3-oxoacyl-[acyl-carrier protein] reductase
MIMTRFETIQLGEKAEIKHVVTQSDLEKFVELTGDDNKLHVDKEYAAKTSFKKPVVHGMLGASFISTIIGTKLPGDGALWFSQNIEFLLPVRIGDELTIRAEVIKKLDKLQVIELQTDIFNQDKQKVTAGVARVKIIEQDTPKEQTELAEPVSGKVALVIGGTGGIGRKTCMALAREGFDVVVHYHSNMETALDLKKDIESLGRKAETVGADIKNEEGVKSIVEFVKRKFEYLTAVINCATSKIVNIKFEDLDWADMQKHIDINVKSNFYLLKYCIPLFSERRYGKVILMTTQAVETPNAEWLPYITAKTALQGFGKASAVELAGKGIRVNMVSAGMTDTDLIADIPEKVRLVTAAKTPLRRLANSEDVASAIVFLASDKSDFMTGETLRINGGQVMI